MLQPMRRGIIGWHPKKVNEIKVPLLSNPGGHVNDVAFWSALLWTEAPRRLSFEVKDPCHAANRTAGGFPVSEGGSQRPVHRDLALCVLGN